MNAPIQPEDEGSRWRLDVIEGRRAQADEFTWSVPGLAIAGQAFLLSIVLSPDVTSTARILAAFAGFFAAVAATHLYGKQLYLFDLYEGFIESERQRLKWPGTQLDELKGIQIPANTTYVKRRWGDESTRRHRLIVRWPSANIWLYALASFVLIDGLLLLYSIAAPLGADPHWLDHGASYK